MKYKIKADSIIVLDLHLLVNKLNEIPNRKVEQYGPLFHTFPYLPLSFFHINIPRGSPRKRNSSTLHL